MQLRQSLLTLAGISAIAGCATQGSPEATAQAQCQYFAREEGMEWVQNVKTAPAADGFGVTMQMKDALGRPFNATCIYAAGKKRWAEPLPANAMSRQEGRDTMVAPKPAQPAR
jgi:hypothetical protein